MFKLIHRFVLCLSALARAIVLIGLIFGSISLAYAKPEYIFLENTIVTKHHRLGIASDLKQQIINLIENSLGSEKDSPYHTIRVRQIYNDQEQLKSVIVYLLSNTNKSVKLIRIDVDQHFNSMQIKKDYQLEPADLAQSPFYSHTIQPKCPDDSVQFIVGNNFYKDASVNFEIMKVFEKAKHRGYNPVLMNINDDFTPVPTVSAYLNWLSCPNVKGFYNESHGWKQGIILADDDFVYSMVDNQLTHKLRGNVLLFDSCETFHNPLLFSMTNKTRGDSQQYIAGYIMLPFGPSERTASCIWDNAFDQQPLTQELIRSCAKRYGLNPEGFKIAGNGNIYLSLPT